jgi:NADP-dependent 3-hydroxy acid dehydrogenase YdfG
MMNAIREPSIDELRQESERGRAQLANTVDKLRDKVGDTAAEIKTLVSPAHVKQEIRTYVREEREKLADTIQRKARENPLQAAAIGAAIAYPAF